jgi:uncharacterized membrane protein YadS
MQHTNLAEMETWKKKTLIVGVVVGALVGVSAAYLYTQRAEDLNYRLEFSTGDGVRLGVLLLGLLRSIQELGDGKK